jgi:hypothetical protein
MPFELAPYDSGKSRRTVILIALTCLMFASAWAYVFYAQKPRVATGAIEDIHPIPVHWELRQGGTMAEGYGGGVEKQDEMLVWVAFHMKNLTEDVPLYSSGQRATLTLPDGEEKFAVAESASEIAKARAAFPQLKDITGTLVPTDLTLQPEKSTSGLALFVFPITPKVWATRREFSVSVAFRYQRDLAMAETRTDR